MHKTDIVDQIVEILNIEIIIRDQTQTDQSIRLIPVPIHILGIDTIQMIDQETHRTIGTEIIPTIEMEANRLIEINDIKIDYEIFQITDQITKDLVITFIKTDHEIIHKIGMQTITIDRETTLNHLIEIKHVIQILKTNKEAKHQRQINQVQTTEETNSDPPGIDNTKTAEKQLNHISYDSTDSESDTENNFSQHDRS